MLVAIILLRREGWPARRAWPGIVCSGLLWFGAYMVLLNWGEREVDAGTAAMVVNIGPILIALLSARLLGEGLPGALLVGLVVSFAGAVVVGVSMSDGGGSSSVLGVSLCLLAAVSYAAGVVAQKPALGHAGALQVTAFGCVIGTVACLPFSGALISEAGDAPLSATLNMVYLGSSRPRSASPPGPSPSPVRPRGGWARRPMSCLLLCGADVLAGAGRDPGPADARRGLLCLAGVAVSRGRLSRGPFRAGARP